MRQDRTVASNSSFYSKSRVMDLGMFKGLRLVSEKFGGRGRSGVQGWRCRRCRNPEINCSQTLLGQSGGHILSQGWQLRWIRDVEAPGGRQVAVPVALRGLWAGQARGLDDNISSVVHSRLGVVAERQPVALDLTGSGWRGDVVGKGGVHHFISRRLLMAHWKTKWCSTYCVCVSLTGW